MLVMSFSNTALATTEACPGSNQILGVKAETNVGASLGIKAFRESDESDPFVNVALAVSASKDQLFAMLTLTPQELDKPLTDPLCFPFGPQVAEVVRRNVGHPHVQHVRTV